MNTQDIQTAILSHYFQHDHIFGCTNFQGAGYDEMDVVTVTRSMWVYEFEAKVSRSDFLADFKKHRKHWRYEMAFQNRGRNENIKGTPNHLFYCCPREMIKVHEVPEYAGLIWFGYIGGEIQFSIVKRAPVLHRNRGTDELVRRICQTLSTRAALKCSLMTYRRNKTRQEKLRRTA